MPSGEPRRGLRSPRLTIHVTQDVIATAAVKDSGHCMIADAVRDTLPNARHISVDLQTIRFTDVDTGNRYVYLTPYPAQAALLDFDEGERADPFTIYLRGAHVIPPRKRGERKAPAQLVKGGDGSTARMERRGGDAPPIGPLHGITTIKPPAPIDETPRHPSGVSTAVIKKAVRRTGRRREFGLRAMGGRRPKPDTSPEQPDTAKGETA